VISHRSCGEQIAGEIPHNPADVGVEFVTVEIREDAFAMLGRKYDVDEDSGKRLRHGEDGCRPFGAREMVRACSPGAMPRAVALRPFGAR
jgi:hypothetical protein